MGQIREVSEQAFEQEVMQSPVPVLLEFGADWCGPFKVVAPELEALSRELGDKARVVKVDIDRSPLLAQTMGIRSVPTFVVFLNGRPVDGRQGALRKAELRALIEPHLPRAAGALKPKEVHLLAEQGRITLVDTREAAVFARSHLRGAVNLPDGELPTRLSELSLLPTPPVLYCRTGKESAERAAQLGEQGFPVAYLEGGVLAWESDGYTLERP